MTAKKKTLAAMTAEVMANNRAHGWYEEARTFGDDMALLHSEVSEALEAFRAHGVTDPTRTAEDVERHHARTGSPHGFCSHGELRGQCGHLTTKPEGIGSEFADVLIRLLDTAGRYGIDLEAEYERKMKYNRTRPYKHGGRAL